MVYYNCTVAILVPASLLQDRCASPTMEPTDVLAQVVSGHTFTVPSRYDLKEGKILGKGSFGIVTTAFDTVRQEQIAIKRIRPFANDEWDARHTLREIRLMRLLASHPNVISLFQVTIHEAKTELYLMMEVRLGSMGVDRIAADSK